MLTNKVRNYQNYVFMAKRNVYLAIYIEMLQEFGVVPKYDGTFYGSLVNLHFDLRQKTQNRIKYNDNRSTITEEGI